jgi:hypothetical protein
VRANSRFTGYWLSEELVGTALLRLPSGNHATFGTKFGLSSFACFCEAVALKSGPLCFEVSNFFAFFGDEAEFEPFKVGFTKREASFHFFAPVGLALLRYCCWFSLDHFWFLFHMYPPIALQPTYRSYGFKT